MCTLRNVTLRLASSSCFPSQLHVASPASCGLFPDIPACSSWHLRHLPSQPGSHPPCFVSGGLYACVTNSPRMDLGRKLETGFLRVPSQCTQGLSHPRAWPTSAPEISLFLLLVETEVCTPSGFLGLHPSQNHSPATIVWCCFGAVFSVPSPTTYTNVHAPTQI